MEPFKFEAQFHQRLEIFLRGDRSGDEGNAQNVPGLTAAVKGEEIFQNHFRTHAGEMQGIGRVDYFQAEIDQLTLFSNIQQILTLSGSGGFHSYMDAVKPGEQIQHESGLHENFSAGKCDAAIRSQCGAFPQIPGKIFRIKKFAAEPLRIIRQQQHFLFR